MLKTKGLKIQKDEDEELLGIWHGNQKGVRTEYF